MTIIAGILLGGGVGAAVGYLTDHLAGGIMVALIAMFPAWIMWAPNAIWKSFDLFVGLIQAFIFALLTVLYFSQSMELDDEHH